MATVLEQQLKTTRTLDHDHMFALVYRRQLTKRITSYKPSHFTLVALTRTVPSGDYCEIRIIVKCKKVQFLVLLS